MDIIPMHISHIIIAMPRRFMLLSSSLYFAEAGRIITLLPANVNPFFVFLHFLQKPTSVVGVFVPSAIAQLSGCTNHKMVYNNTE